MSNYLKSILFVVFSVLWLFVLGPWLISAKSTIAVVLGVISTFVVYPFITYHYVDKVLTKK